MAEKYLRVIFGGMPEENNNSDIKWIGKNERFFGKLAPPRYTLNLLV